MGCTKAGSESGVALEEGRAGTSACLLEDLESTLPNLANTASATVFESSGSISDSTDFKASLSGRMDPQDLTTVMGSWMGKGPRPRNECHSSDIHFCFSMSPWVRRGWSPNDLP